MGIEVFGWFRHRKSPVVAGSPFSSFKVGDSVIVLTGKASGCRARITEVYESTQLVEIVTELPAHSEVFSEKFLLGFQDVRRI